MKTGAEQLDVTSEELVALLEGARAVLGETGYQKLHAAIRTLGYVTELLETRLATLDKLRRLLCHTSTEKTKTVLKQAGIETGEKKHKPPDTAKSKVPGHGRNGCNLRLRRCCAHQAASICELVEAGEPLRVDADVPTL